MALAADRERVSCSLLGGLGATLAGCGMGAAVAGTIAAVGPRLRAHEPRHVMLSSMRYQLGRGRVRPPHPTMTVGPARPGGLDKPAS